MFLSNPAGHSIRSSPTLVRAFLPRRNLLTLAIETSCDDTSVAILETHDAVSNDAKKSAAKAASLHYHEMVTSDNRQYLGIHPIVSLESHGKSLANLVSKSLQCLPLSQWPQKVGGKVISVSGSGPPSWRRIPDFVSVTRGPGMRSNLATGLNTAKGLAVAWEIPLVGVHHMQAHALTPRLVAALQQGPGEPRSPGFPFLSLLVSGGHTLLVHSTSLTNHSIIATTADIAIGDTLDKAARLILPKEWVSRSATTMYGRLLEEMAFPDGGADYDYHPPVTRADELNPSTLLGRKLKLPFTDSKELRFSFSGIQSTVQRLLSAEALEKISLDERKELARVVMRVSFEHLASRVVIALKQLKSLSQTNTLVISGGVASNRYLKTILRSFLDIRGFSNVQLIYPPASLCTDNAAMIAWAGIEMFQAGWTTDLSCDAIRTWSMDPSSADGGILGASGWEQH